MKNASEQESEDIDPELFKISLNKNTVSCNEEKVSLTPEASRRSRTPRYMEVDNNVNNTHGAYGDSPDRGYSTPRSEGRKSAALVHVDLSKKLKIQEPQRTPRINPNNVLLLEMEPPSRKDADSPKNRERSLCQTPEEPEVKTCSGPNPQRKEKESPPRKIGKHENKGGKNSPLMPKCEKDSSKQRKNVNKSKKNTKNMKEKIQKKEFKRTDSKPSVGENTVNTHSRKEYKRIDSRSSVGENALPKERKGNCRTIQKETDVKGGKSFPKNISKKPFDSKENLYYSDDFDESGDASDIEEGEFAVDFFLCCKELIKIFDVIIHPLFTQNLRRCIKIPFEINF